MGNSPIFWLSYNSDHALMMTIEHLYIRLNPSVKRPIYIAHENCNEFHHMSVVKLTGAMLTELLVQCYRKNLVGPQELQTLFDNLIKAAKLNMVTIKEKDWIMDGILSGKIVLEGDNVVEKVFLRPTNSAWSLFFQQKDKSYVK